MVTTCRPTAGPRSAPHRSGRWAGAGQVGSAGGFYTKVPSARGLGDTEGGRGAACPHVRPCPPPPPWDACISGFQSDTPPPAQLGPPGSGGHGPGHRVGGPACLSCEGTARPPDTRGLRSHARRWRPGPPFPFRFVCGQKPSQAGGRDPFPVRPPLTQPDPGPGGTASPSLSPELSPRPSPDEDTPQPWDPPRSSARTWDRSLPQTHPVRRCGPRRGLHSAGPMDPALP